MQHCCAVCDALAAGVLFCLGCYYVFLCSRCCQEKQLLWDHPAGAGNANPYLQSTRHCFNPGDRERRLQPSGTLVVQLRNSPSLASLLTSLRRNLKTSHSKNVSSSISSRIQGSSLLLPGLITGHGIFNPELMFLWDFHLLETSECLIGLRGSFPLVASWDFGSHSQLETILGRFALLCLLPIPEIPQLMRIWSCCTCCFLSNQNFL